MACGIIRVQKVKSTAVGAMQRHIDRQFGRYSNEDIDPERSYLNEELIPHGEYAQEIHARIEKFKKPVRKVRKDAVVLVEGVATASPEFFAAKDAEEVRAFFGDVFEFVKAEAGEQNMVHFTVHMDESTPHAHFGFTPIKDGSLSWKKFFDGKYGLRAFQDRFWEQVGRKWGLERGEKAAETSRKHRDTAQMKRDNQRELREIEFGITRMQIERLKRSLQTKTALIEKQRAQIDELKRELDKVTFAMRELRRTAATKERTR